MKKTTILFDLDGTLVNTGRGITRCVKSVLTTYGIQEENQEKIETFIGPPLRDSFQREYGFSLEKAAEAAEIFQKKYHEGAIFECELYPQIKETLQYLKEQGYRIAVASSKTESSCKQLMEHFEIANYFEIIGGATQDGKISTKIQVLQYVMDTLKITNKEELVLIGDTKYDAAGAKAAGIDCIGITYGFGKDPEELKNAGAIYVCDTLKEVISYLER
ncbi:MAG: HAD-IA family hydrolase [Lachnospiraceae bacterium]